jgi:hypothetical protein
VVSLKKENMERLFLSLAVVFANGQWFGMKYKIVLQDLKLFLENSVQFVETKWDNKKDASFYRISNVKLVLKIH